MRKTKIICTIGPASENEETLTQMCLAGMNVARLNFSHGTHAEHERKIELVKRVRQKLGLPIAIMLDTKGPEYRIGTFASGKVEVKTGDSFTFTTQDVAGDETKVSVNYKNLHKDLKPGNTVTVNNGIVQFEVESIEGTEIHCKCLAGGTLSDRKSMSFPNKVMSGPYISQQDRSDILFGIAHGVDYVAASFVSTKQDVLDIRKLLDENGGSDIEIVAKIENRSGVDNVEEICSVCGGIMIARGDLGVEIPYVEVPSVQKKLTRMCRMLGKRVITATEMLESMIQNPRPTRAEITDVANAIYDGTSAIMLSGETAAGKYPVEAVRTMDAIARKTESNVERICPAKTPKRTRLSITAATAHAACTTAEDIGADAILTVSQRGITAQMVSRFRPAATVVALLLDPQVQRQMALYWGLVPITMPRASSTDQLVDLAIQSAQEAGLVKHGDLVVVTAGVPVGISGTTNMIRIAQVGGALVNAIGIGSQTASGPLCICRTLEEIPEKFHPGDVLVVPYTNNDVVPWLRQAAAIVSEEASADCHTATVGLLLNKPVIVAASDATRRLKNGTLVSVDCARGIVQTIPQ